MSQQQEIAADRLVKVIQAVQIGRKTGELIARRGEGVTFEEGTIIFVNGQVTEASVGRRNGSEALNWLSTWSNCRYTFKLSTTSELTSPRTPTTLDISELETLDTAAHPSTSPQTPNTVKQTAPLAPGGGDTTKSGSPVHTLPTPYRTLQIDTGLRIIENIGLSRSHRHLFLLVNGQRSIAELIRLMGRSQLEINALLQDLEGAAVIRIETSSKK
jgi:hypothetical protein